MPNTDAVVEEKKQYTEEELINLPDDEFEKAMMAQETSEPEEKTEDAEPTDQEAEETEPSETSETSEVETERSEEETVALDRELSEEDIKNLSARDRGFYYEMKKEREKRQEAEKRAEQMQFANEAQLKLLKELRGEPKQESHQSEYERVYAELQQKEADGEYLTVTDFNKLEQAKEKDNQYRVQLEQQQAEERRRVERVHEVDRLEAEFREVHSDYVEVWNQYAPKLFDLGADGQPTTQKGWQRLNKMIADDNPAAYFYDYLVRQTPEGKQYFQDKAGKAKNAEVLNKIKPITETTASTSAKKGASGQKITPKEYGDNIDHWSSVLTSEQQDRLCMGESIVL